MTTFGETFPQPYISPFTSSNLIQFVGLTHSIADPASALDLSDWLMPSDAFRSRPWSGGQGLCGWATAGGSGLCCIGALPSGPSACLGLGVAIGVRWRKHCLPELRQQTG